MKQMILSMLFLTLVIVCGMLTAFSKVYVKQDSVFIIPHNTSTREISRSLASQQNIDHQVPFFIFAKIYCKFYKKVIIAGEYALKGGMDVLEIMKMLTGGKVIQHIMMIPEGFTVRQVLQKIAMHEEIKHFPDKITAPEGSLLPETYFFTYGTLDMEIIRRMQKMMQDFLAVEWPKRDKKIDQIISSPEAAVILASIVEKETYINSEKAHIAAVYLNRLKKGMKLQADPTVIYGLGLHDDESWNGKVLYSHLKMESQYNTYIHKGLPPTPICNPGRIAILAVLHPQWNDNFFFVSKGQGKHIFASNFEQHKKNISLRKKL
jgi:UPF0755 protein